MDSHLLCTEKIGETVNPLSFLYRFQGWHGNVEGIMIIIVGYHLRLEDGFCSS